MKKVVFILALLMLVSNSLYADLFSPNRPLYEIHTRFFIIIYPLESSAAANYLAGFADDACLEIAELLGTRLKTKLPIVISPDSEDINGYYSPFPYPHIVLYQAPIDINSSLGSFDNNLYKLFYHELTHALSLSIRSKFEDVIANIFGQAISAPVFFAPYSFVEGVTVSLESLNGYGRAKDPLIAADIKQDIIEGKFKSFAQASGAYDLYPFGTLFYHYGGYFSKYLQERFGMDSYAKIWTKFGLSSLFIPFGKGLFSKGSFYNVFGISLEEAWNDFYSEMAIKGPIISTVEKLSELSYITAFATDGYSLFWQDIAQGSVYSLNTKTGIKKELFKAGSYISRIESSLDEAKLLLSTQEEKEGLPRLALKEWSQEDGKVKSLDVSGLQDAVYTPVPGRYLGILADGYMTHLAFAGSGAVSVLIKGTELLSFSSPAISADGKELFCLAKENGLVSILKIGLDAPLGKINSIEKLKLPEELTWLRYLSLDEQGRLQFAWDDNSLYRLAELERETLSWQTVPVSGGVHYPLLADGSVYYIGRFSDGHAVCSMPSDRTPFAFFEETVSWEDAGYLLEQPSAFSSPAFANSPEIKLNPYKPARWLLPRFWLPQAALDEDGFYAFGALSLLSDPIESWSVGLSALWNTRVNALSTSLELGLMLWEPLLSLSLSDSFVYDDSWYRSSQALLGIEWEKSFFAGHDLSLGFSAGTIGSALLAEDEGAYATWTKASVLLDGDLALLYERRKLSDMYTPTGYNMALKASVGKNYLGNDDFFAGFESMLKGFIRPFGLSLSVYGAANLYGDIAYGPLGREVFGGAPTSGLYPLWKEFSKEDAASIYGQAELSFTLLAIELQMGTELLYFNRLAFKGGSRAYASVGEDFSLYSSGWSAFARAELTATPVLGVLATIHPVFSIELWLRPDKKQDDIIPHGLDIKILVLL